MSVISVNELISTCQKVAEVYGYGWGSNTDIAELICWLELNQLRGLARFQELIDQDSLTQQSPVHYVHCADSLTIDGLGQSAVHYALASLDFAKALSERQRRSAGDQPLRLTVNNVADALFFVAATATMQIDQTVSLGGEDNGAPFSARVARHSVDLTTSDSTKEQDGGASQLTICIPASSNGKDPASTNPKRSRTFNYRRTYTDALANGVSVDATLWQSLLNESKRILVPSSEHSRLFGTGGGNAND